MYSFIKQYVEKIDHAQIYPMISFVIFFLFFVALIYYVIKMDKAKTIILSNIPLDDKEAEIINI